MCIIVYKDVELDMPSKQALQNCFESNPDGAGYMLRLPDGKILIRKGFLKFNDLWNSLQSITDVKSKELCIHFRYATHGDKSAGNTHPFPVTRKIHTMRKLRLVCDVAIVHNGIISGLTHDDKTLSDTMCMVKRIVTEGEQSESVQKALLAGKFVIMDAAETRIYGVFMTDTETGIMYSNDAYKEPIYNIYEDFGAMSACNSKYFRRSYEEWNMIDEYNKQYGTDFLTWEEIEAHMDLLDICEDCIWFQELDGKCYITGQYANPEEKDCSFSPWNRHNPTNQIPACRKLLTDGTCQEDAEHLCK